MPFTCGALEDEDAEQRERLMLEQAHHRMNVDTTGPGFTECNG